MLGLMTMLAGILTMLNPVAAEFGGIGAIVGLRVVQGLVQVRLKFLGQWLTLLTL
jgi:hypothetical protein